MKTIGIIGNGFVGSAIASGFGLHADIKIYDIDPLRSTHTFEEVVSSEFVFVSVPTPMNASDENKIDLSIMEQVFSKISDYNQDNPHNDSVYILKSTVVPGTTQSLADKFPNIDLVFNPEFLTERSARLDFINASRVVLGGSRKAVKRTAELYRDRFPFVTIVETDTSSAEFIKYMCNCFFATKVSFMNEMRQAVDVLGLDWEKIMNGFVTDGRIGNSHLDVPGHDGSLGFGGKCFPKDINAFINFFKDSNVEPTVMTAAWEKNLEVRKNQDWLKIKGAVSKKKK
jgi:nucleotide sugar dehydrogenase